MILIGFEFDQTTIYHYISAAHPILHGVARGVEVPGDVRPEVGVVGHHGLEVGQGLVPGPGRRHQVALHSGGRMGLLGFLGHYWMGLTGLLRHHWFHYEGSLGLTEFLGHHWLHSLLVLLLFFIFLVTLLLFPFPLFLLFLLFLMILLTGRQGL